ncbi:hypothetical protein R2R70_02490 [Cobetia sp. SIMBA_158]|uniref:hypothetical protein n=1 Tax=Cobetia sp. SIMBA_158 TaxID=3081617 RepID=UPI00397F09F9
MNPSLLTHLLKPLDGARLECDGMSSVISWGLHEQGVTHRVKSGMIHRGDVSICHVWIELFTGHVIDLRARMWLGDRLDVPHGVFRPEDYPHVTYIEHPDKERMGVMDGWLVMALSDGLAGKVRWSDLAREAKSEPRVAQ